MAGEGRHRRGPRPSPWRVLGIVVAVVAVGAGLAFVGYVALVAIALNSWSSNK